MDLNKSDSSSNVVGAFPHEQESAVVVSCSRAYRLQDGRKRQNNTDQAETDALYEQIGRLKAELDWLKKKGHARLTSCAGWWSRIIRILAFGGNGFRSTG
jgi:hypothetical protein